MHKGIIILTKASNKEEAIDNVEEYLDGEGDHIFDWYKIGGRYSSLLSTALHSVPLKDCIKKVKDYSKKTFIEKGNEELKQANEYLKKKDYEAYGYCLECAGKIFAQCFYDECDIYNINKANYSIPAKEEEIEEYYAVITDIAS